jgi:hypothetical protein
MSKTNLVAKTHSKLGWYVMLMPVTAIRESFEKRGYEFFTTSRNYYYSFKKGRVAYNNMGAEGSSAEYYADLYVRIEHKGRAVYRWVTVVTENSIDDIVERVANSLDNDSTPELYEAFLDGLNDIPKAA